MKRIVMAAAMMMSTVSVAPVAQAEDAPKVEAKVSAEHKVGTGVEQHKLVGQAATFPAGTTVWAWSRISNGPKAVKHVWKLDGTVVWTATLPVKSSKWSTMSRRLMSKPGHYEVELTTDDDQPIEKTAFDITEK
jgi:hypothetical protein